MATDRAGATSGHDVYAFGVVAPSTLVVLDDDYPPSGGYAEVEAVHRSFGGEAAGSAAVLARLGVSTKLDGNWLGDDDASSHAIALLTDAGVDCRRIRRRADTRSVREVVISGAGERTVLGTYRQLAVTAAWGDPSYDDIAASRVVCLDPFFAEASLQAARWCRAAGTPYVTIDVPPDSEIGHGADVLVVSEEYATRELGDRDPRSLLAAYTDRCGGLVVLTHGADAIVSGRSGEPPLVSAPFAVDVRDTTGAGDSFRAGVIFAMLRGDDDPTLVRVASAVAGMVCERSPGTVDSPTAGELRRFLDERGEPGVPR